MLRALLAHTEEHGYVRDPQGRFLVGFLGIAGDRATHAHRLHEIIATQRDVATADLDVEAMMGLLCERTMELTGADGATVALLNDGELRIGASRGSPVHPAGELLSLDASLGGLAIRDRRSLITQDALEDPRVNPERVRATGVRSFCPDRRAPSTTRT